MLVNHVAERDAIDRLLRAARGGAGGALLLRGEVGIGKSELLDYAAARADGMAVVGVAGVASETPLAYAAAQRLLAPLLDRSGGDLPDAQRHALSGALGVGEETPPDGLLVGLAALTVLVLAAAARPLLCTVDDLQWIDLPSVQLLAFVARRISTENIAMLLALREPAEPSLELDDLPALHVGAIPDDAARELLKAAARAPLDDRVGDRIVAEAHGNPGALLELEASLTPAQLVGGAALPEPLLPRGALARSFAQRVHSLPADTRTLLLLLAMQRDADAEVFRLAADRLGIAEAAADAAVAAGLLDADGRPAFRHPSIRAAVLGAAHPHELQRVNEALAAATSPSLDPDDSLWYRAAAALEPDEQIAAELVRSATRTLRRSGSAAAAALLARAAELTPDPARHAERLLAAAGAEFAAGATARAAALLADATPGLTEERQRVEARRLRGEIDHELGRSGESPGALLEAARSLAPLDVRLSRDMHLEALVAAIYACRLGPPGGVHAAARAACDAPPVAPADATAADLLLDGFALLFAEGHGAAAPVLRQAIERLRSEDDLRLILLGGHAATEIGDDAALHMLANRGVELARERGELAALPRALNYLAGSYEILVGRLDAAQACLREARAIRASIAPAVADRGRSVQTYVDAWRGREADARASAHATIRDAAARGQGIEIAAAQSGLAVLELGLGRYQAAFAAAREATEYDALHVVTTTLPDLVEAAACSGDPEAASEALGRLADRAVPAGTPWALGMLARSGALLARSDEAEALYREAIAHLQQSRAVPQLARAHLVYGEWLRRQRRRLDARSELRLAYEMFSSMGAAAFAERARVELAATGERARRRTADTLGRLTPQEARIAMLVAGGASNGQVAQELLISRRTVEYHLGKIYRKLGLSSRHQLAPVVSDENGSGQDD